MNTYGFKNKEEQERFYANFSSMEVIMRFGDTELTNKFGFNGKKEFTEKMKEMSKTLISSGWEPINGNKITIINLMNDAKEGKGSIYSISVNKTDILNCEMDYIFLASEDAFDAVKEWATYQNKDLNELKFNSQRTITWEKEDDGRIVMYEID